jgi:hypothetical protein
MDAHRWSGWPGAWCLDCGAEDPYELCLADHTAPDPTRCGDHPMTSCPCPGAALFDPYTARALHDYPFEE